MGPQPMSAADEIRIIIIIIIIRIIIRVIRSRSRRRRLHRKRSARVKNRSNIVQRRPAPTTLVLVIRVVAICVVGVIVRVGVGVARRSRRDLGLGVLARWGRRDIGRRGAGRSTRAPGARARTVVVLIIRPLIVGVVARRVAVVVGIGVGVVAGTRAVGTARGSRARGRSGGAGSGMLRDGGRGTAGPRILVISVVVGVDAIMVGIRIMVGIDAVIVSVRIMVGMRIVIVIVIRIRIRIVILGTAALNAVATTTALQSRRLAERAVDLVLADGGRNGVGLLRAQGKSVAVGSALVDRAIDRRGSAGKDAERKENEWSGLHLCDEKKDKRAW